MKYKHRLTALTALACASALTACSGQSGSQAGTSAGDPVQREFFAMDTYMTLTAYGDEAEAALEKAQTEVEKLESEWSVTNESSEIYQMNHSQGSPVTLSDDTADIVSFALEMAKETGGDLDPTIYPVLAAWGFTTDENRIPSQEELDGLLANVGYERVELDGNTVQLPEGMEFDLGAVGKGYAGDRLAELLKEAFRENGYTFYLESPTNQQFILLEDVQAEQLSREVSFSFWEKPDATHTVVRFVTSWATREEDIEKLKQLLRKYRKNDG